MRKKIGIFLGSAFVVFIMLLMALIPTLECQRENYVSKNIIVDDVDTSFYGAANDEKLNSHLPPELTLIPPEYHFGQVEVGSYKRESFYLTNIGYDTAKFHVTLEGMTSQFEIVSGGGENLELKSGKIRTIKVEFHPSYTGNHWCRLIIFGVNCDNVYSEIDGDGISPPPPTCFAAGTKITMADGSQKNVEDIKIGNKIMGYDLEKNQFTSWTVRILDRPFNSVCNINNGLLRITPEHPIHVSKSNGILGIGAVRPLNNAMIIASEIIPIDVGDKIFTSDKTWVEINNISFESTKIQLYNFVSYTGKNTYFANDILVYEDFTKPIWNLIYIFKNSETPIRSLIDFLKTLQFLP